MLRGYSSWVFVLAGLLAALNVPAAPRCESAMEFAPAQGWVAEPEKPWRQEMCLNGRWQFQPVAIPRDYRRDQGAPPELTLPAADGWAADPIRIPSPWNVNAWGAGRNVGAGTNHPYWPSSVYYPSYPEAWDNVEMGWLRRTFQPPREWQGRRIVLHFEAVAGECQVRVNGKLAGGHFDKYLPFELDVTDLVKLGEPNELLVGVRSHRLFNKQSPRYSKMRAPYPCGSETERLVGIWQDVYLLALPAVRVEDVFVKPLVDQEALEVEITLRNDTEAAQAVRVDGNVHPWINQAGADVGTAPEPRWTLGPAALRLGGKEVTVAPKSTQTLVLRQRVDQKLSLWSPDSPNLYGAVLSVSQKNQALDTRFTRFGWRQFTLAGRDLLLNGRKIQLFGDFLHPFGPFTMSRRYVWAWYRMIKDVGGNSARPHAQIHPRAYLELADEMGIVILDETAIFGSSIQLNFDDPTAWKRFEEHYDGLVMRDRNHPCVVGWSFGNELFAIFNLNQVSEADTTLWYKQLTDLGARARRLDPTRPWISCDGDEHLRGTLPVWSKHFGHGTPLDRLPDIDKPLMVGESGGTYYARPAQLAMFNGARAFADYAGRNEALAIDVYDNIARMARPRLAYYSASETVWFGLEHLGYGYRDFTRLPGPDDGVFFTRPFEEGKPGMQPERLPPYVSTLNPGWDPQLPLYKPLAMFHAQKAALAKGGPQPCAWDRKVEAPKSPAPATRPAPQRARFVGDRTGALAKRLQRLGVAWDDQTGTMSIIDGDGLAAGPAEVRAALDRAKAGGTAILMLGSGKASAEALAALLEGSLRLTDRPATALVADPSHAWTGSLTVQDLYFAEDGADRFILRHGLEGELVARGRVLLKAGRADWSLFNEAPEVAKCAAAVLYEQMTHPSGAALVECDYGKGKLVLCTIDSRIATKAANALWRKLLANMGVELNAAQEGFVEAFTDDGTLVNALAIGRFDGTDAEAALAKDYLGDAAARPRKGAACGGLTWKMVNAPSKDRFILNQLKQDGPEDVFVTYFSYWIKSPRSLDDLLADGPDAPRFSTFCYVSEACRLYLNGREIAPGQTEPADYRTRYTFDGMPLRKGWNHVLIKVVSTRLKGDRPATLAVRIGSSSRDYFRQIETAVEPQE